MKLYFCSLQRLCRKLFFTTFDKLQELINEHKPQVIFAETPSGSQTSSGMKSYGMTCQLIAVLKPEPIEVTPIEVKVAFTGSFPVLVLMKSEPAIILTQLALATLV